MRCPILEARTGSRGRFCWAKGWYHRLDGPFSKYHFSSALIWCFTFYLNLLQSFLFLSKVLYLSFWWLIPVEIKLSNVVLGRFYILLISAISNSTHSYASSHPYFQECQARLTHAETCVVFSLRETLSRFV